MILVYLLIFFLLPLFPFSLVTNRLLSRLKPKFFSLFMIAIFTFGNLLLVYVDMDFRVIRFLAIFTIFFYSFRLLGVRDLKSYILYIYPVVSSISILWYIVGGDALEFMAVKIPILISFLTLFSFLSGHFSVIHQKSLTGLGNVMPRFSIFFIISILSLSSSFIFLGYGLLESELSKLSFIYAVLLILSWIFLNYGSIKLIEWLIYGVHKEDRVYKDLTLLESLFLAFMLSFSALSFIIYGMRGLV